MDCKADDVLVASACDSETPAVELDAISKAVESASDVSTDSILVDSAFDV